MENYEKSFNNICRLCLKYDESNETTSLVDSNRENGLSVYGDCITKLTSLNINLDDNLPRNICFGCKNELKRIECFKSMCKMNCERLNLLVNDYYKRSSKEAKMNAVVQYSMFTQHFPDRCQKSYLKQLEGAPLKSVIKNLRRNGVENSSDTIISCKKDAMLPKQEVKIEYNDTNNISDLETQNAPMEGQSRSISEDNKSFLDLGDNNSQDRSSDDISQLKTENIDLFLDQMEKIFTKTHPKPKGHNSFNNLSDIDTFLEQMEKIFTKTHLKPKRRIDKSSPQNFTCNLCNKKLMNKYSFKYHMQRHTEPGSFICDQCGKGYATKGTLKIHRIALHGVSSSYECDHCSFKAPQRIELIEHIRLHTGERPFTCEKCGMKFRRRALYISHIKCHDEKKVQCPKCPKKFYRAGEMRLHMNSNHERIHLYLCHICNTSYTLPKTVRKHMISKHGIARENQGKILRVMKNTHKGLFKESKDDKFD